MSKALARRTQNTPATITKLAKNCDLVVADISGSMLSPAANGKSKLECLKLALKTQQGRIGVLAFSGSSWECANIDEIPDRHGTTNLSGALEHAERLEPMHILVMCDGQPDHEASALTIAARLAGDCIIDTLFIGSDSDEQGVDFMRELARVGRGRFQVFDLEKVNPLLLESKIAGLLAGPVDETIKL